jgi:protein-disulfide isomerase
MSIYRAHSHRNGVPATPQELRSRGVRRLWIVTLCLVVLCGAGVVGWQLIKASQPKPMPTPAGVSNDGGEQGGMTVAGNGPTTVEVYFDLLCGNCRLVQSSLGTTLDDLAAQNRIRLVWHPVAVNNGLTNPPGYATRAANAVACAADFHKAREFAAALYENVPRAGTAGPNDDQLIDLAGPVGLNAPAFAQCVREMRYEQWIGVVGQRAAQRGLPTLPAIYVNGTPLDQPTSTALNIALR